MANDQQPLDGAHNGPAIPPSGQPRHSHHRGRSWFCCLFSVFGKSLLTCVLLGLPVLIWNLIVHPRPFKFYVNEAKLTEFDYTNNTLRYNMALNFTVSNPNKKLSIYYDKVEALAFYEGSRFDSDEIITQMNSFQQDKKSSIPMNATFSGQQVMVLDSDQLSELSKDKSARVYDINVKLHFSIRLTLRGDPISDDYEPKVKCDLKVPMNSNATFTFFAVTKCDVDFWKN